MKQVFRWESCKCTFLEVTLPIINIIKHVCHNETIVVDQVKRKLFVSIQAQFIYYIQGISHKKSFFKHAMYLIPCLILACKRLEAFREIHEKGGGRKYEEK